MRLSTLGTALLATARRRIACRLALLVAAMLITAVAVLGLLELRQDSNPSIWLNPHTHAQQDYDDIRALFPEEASLSILLQAPDVLSADNLAWMHRVQNKIDALAHVQSSLSVLTAQDLLWDDLGASPITLIRDDSAQEPLEQSEKYFATTHPLYGGMLIEKGDANHQEKNATWMLIVIRQQDALRWPAILALGASLQNILRDQPMPPGSVATLAGISLQQTAINDAVIADQKKILLWSAALMLVLSLLLYGSPRFSLIPFLALASACAGIGSILVLRDQALNAVLGLLPPLIAAISVATSLHIVHASVLHHDHPTPLWAGIGASARGIIGSTLTTMLGFSGLMYADLPAVQTFGLYAAIGVGCAVLSAYAWSIIILPWTSHVCFSLAPRCGIRQLSPLLRRLAQWSIRRRLLVCCTWGALTIVAIVALFNMRTDNDLLAALPASMPVVAAQHRIDTTVGGSTALELVIHLNHALNDTDIQTLDTMATHYTDFTYIRHLQSINNIIAFAHDTAALADDPQSTSALLRDLRDYLPSTYKQFVHSSQTANSSIRIIGLCPDVALELISTDAHAFTRLAAASFPHARISLTTPHTRLKESADTFLPSILNSLYVIIPAIAAISLWVFRRYTAVLIAVVSVLIPTILGVACLPLLGWSMDLPQTMISCIVIGIVIDDILHWMIHRHRCRDSITCNAEMGPVLAASSLILIAASSCYLCGDFAHTQRFGLVISATFAYAIILTLTLLPALFPQADTTPVTPHSEKDTP